MSITSVLPSFVGLKSNYNNKFLRYISEDVQTHGFLQFSGEEVLSPYSKYQVEVSKNHDGLVHIRSCYNNKYWVRWSSNYWWIVAGADEPNEDGSSWSCTLFEPVGGDDTDTGIRFRHVQLGHFVCLSSDVSVPPPFDGCLYAGSASPNTNLNDVCSVVDLESLLVLPKYIAFKGDNDMYLSAQTLYEGNPYLRFSSSNIADPTVQNEVFITPNGSVRIKSTNFDKFWRRSDVDNSWIWADSSDDTTNDPDTLFWPVKVVDDNNNNVVAPLNLGNSKFCKRLTTMGVEDCLSAVDTTISVWGRLEVAELVTSRDIFDVKYRVMDARIYDQRVVVMATEQATNTTNQPTTQQVTPTYQETKSRAWKSSVSLKFRDVKLTLQSDGIPFISRGRLEILDDGSSGEYVWGEANSTTTTVESPYIVTVPPRTRVIVSKIATQAYYDVPFSYSQRDTLMDGTIDTLEFDDGVYTSFNSYNYKYETKEEPL